MAHHIINAVAILAAASAVAGAAAAQQPENMFYNIAPDASSLELVDLGGIERHGRTATVYVNDVFRHPDFMLGSTWKVNCTSRAVTLSHLMRVEPGRPVEQLDVHRGVQGAGPSSKAALLYQFGCDGKANLIASRVYREDLADVAKRFWAQ